MTDGYGITKPSCFFLLLANFLLVSATGPALKNEGWKQMCTLAATLDKTPGMAKGKLVKIAQGAFKADSTALKLMSMAAAESDNRSKAAFRGLSRVVSRTAVSLAQKTQKVADDAIQATALSARTSGKINELTALLNNAADDGSDTGGCLAAAGDTNIAEHAETKAAWCSYDAPSYASTEATIPDTEISAAGFSQAKGVEDAKAETAANKCVLFDGTGGKSAGKFYQHTTKVSQVDGYLTITGAGAATTTALVIEDLQQVGTPGKQTSHKNLHDLHAAVKRINDEDTTAIKTTDEAIIKEAAIDSSLNDAIQAELKIISGSEDQSKLKQEATEIIKEFVNDDNKKGEKAWQKLKSTKVKGTEAQPETEKELKDINDNATLVSALNYYISSAESKLQEAETKLAAAKAAAEKVPTAPKPDECKAKKGDTCKDGCKWDSDGENKKCVVDPNYTKKQVDEAAAKDDKTNTTGSNSFVIDKTPLLFAFLLF
uniref:Variant surface glycoprotein 1125.345 n=1 Tax=Trypanosoma brucei TaxID=5691 RepID=A0A1J0R4F1_9TRYP|nr:variant surface glycoprotein 1125.345 [Trypanosoma brucei]